MSGISNIYHGTPPQEVVRRGVEGSLSHTLLHTLQVLLDKDKVFFISLYFYKSISLIGIYPTQRDVQNAGGSPHNSSDLLGCGACLSNLKVTIQCSYKAILIHQNYSFLVILFDSQLTDASQVNDFGTISVSSTSSSCVWLLHTKVANKHSLDDTKYYIL